MMRKLRSRSGESLTETLVALLISCLALLMLAGAVSAATRVVLRSRDRMTEYYAADGALAVRAGARGTLSVSLSDTSDSALDLEDIPADYYENDAFARHPVIAYAASETGDAP